RREPFGRKRETPTPKQHGDHGGTERTEFRQKKASGRHEARRETSAAELLLPESPDSVYLRVSVSSVLLRIRAFRAFALSRFRGLFGRYPASPTSCARACSTAATPAPGWMGWPRAESVSSRA